MGIVDWLGGLYKFSRTLTGIQVEYLELLREALVSGEMDWGKHFALTIETLDAWEDANDEIEQMVRAASILAAVLSYGQIVAAIASGQIVIPGLQTTMDLWDRMEPTFERVQERYEAEEERLRGVVNRAEIQQSLKLMQTVHTVGMTFSRSYRQKVREFYEGTAEISRAVFGTSMELTSALNLLQMVTADATRLAGDPVDIGDRRFFDQSLRAIEMVELNSSRYARNPAQFWADFQSAFIAGEQERARQSQSDLATRMGSISATAVRAEELASAIDQRSGEYLTELGPLLSEDRQRELDTMRRDYQLKVVDPLEQFAEFMAETWPEVEPHMEATDMLVTKNMEEIDALTQITADPETLTEEERVRQANRVDSWVAHLQRSGDYPDRESREAIAQVRSIYDRLQRE